MGAYSLERGEDMGLGVDELAQASDVGRWQPAFRHSWPAQARPLPTRVLLRRDPLHVISDSPRRQAYLRTDTGNLIRDLLPATRALFLHSFDLHTRLNRPTQKLLG